MPGDSGVTVVTMLVCFFIFARKAAGALSARHSLRPLISEGELSWQNPDASRRGNAKVYPCHCEKKMENRKLDNGVLALCLACAIRAIVILRCEPSWASLEGCWLSACGPSFEARKCSHLRMTGDA
jgi:hypothetical protein